MKFDIKRVVVSAELQINPIEEKTLNDFANIILSLEKMFDGAANFKEFVYEYYNSMSNFIKAFSANTDEVIKNIANWLKWD